MLSVGIRSLAVLSTLNGSLIIIVIVVPDALVLATSHTDITSNTDAAALLGNQSTELCALCKTWELLCAEDSEWLRLDLESMRHVLRGLREDLRV